MLPAALSVFANFSPISTELQSALWFIGGGTVSFIGAVLAVLIYFKRNPPLDAQLADFKASISDLDEEVARLREQREEDQKNQRAYTQRTTRELFDRIERVESSISENFRSLERALGRLEGELKARHQQ
jgi:hypothetical protein